MLCYFFFLYFAGDGQGGVPDRIGAGTVFSHSAQGGQQQVRDINLMSYLFYYNELFIFIIMSYLFYCNESFIFIIMSYLFCYNELFIFIIMSHLFFIIMSYLFLL